MNKMNKIGKLLIGVFIVMVIVFFVSILYIVTNHPGEYHDEHTSYKFHNVYTYQYHNHEYLLININGHQHLLHSPECKNDTTKK